VNNLLFENIQKHIDLITNYVQYKKSKINQLANMIIECFQRGNKVLIFGNGGSASDSQHIAGEFMNKIKVNVAQPMPAISLSSDISVVTSIANDINYDSIFSRQIQMLGKKGDISIGLSTSGRSENFIKGIESSLYYGLSTVIFTGQIENNLDYNLGFKIPSNNTARIQEVYMFILHTVCEMVEQHFYNWENS
jgi:D-sedoheptulose 7-phosphate isomerase